MLVTIIVQVACSWSNIRSLSRLPELNVSKKCLTISSLCFSRSAIDSPRLLDLPRYEPHKPSLSKWRALYAIVARELARLQGAQENSIEVRLAVTSKAGFAVNSEYDGPSQNKGVWHDQSHPGEKGNSSHGHGFDCHRRGRIRPCAASSRAAGKITSAVRFRLRRNQRTRPGPFQFQTRRGKDD